MATKATPAPTRKRKRRPVSINIVVWGSFAVGILGSIGFNVGSTIMTNGLGLSILGAVMWPLLNVGAVEMMIRAPWRKGPLWTFARYGLTGLVALISFIVSYTHISHVLTAWGEAWITTVTGPLAIDGLMLLAGAALVAMHAPKTPARRRKPATAPARRKPALAAAA
jgi:hypothetical protein